MCLLKISNQAIFKIIPETCDAIVEVMKKNVMVNELKLYCIIT